MTGSAAGRFEETLVALEAGLDELLEISCADLSLEEVEDVVERFYRLTHRAEAVKLHLLRAATSKTTRHAVKSFLTTAPRNVASGQADRDLDLARFTDPDVDWDGAIGGQRGDRGALALTGAKLAAGDASRAHLDLAQRALTSMPSPVRRGTLTTVEVGRDGVQVEVSRPKARVLDGFLASTVAEVAPGAAKQITDDILMLLDPQRADRGQEPDCEAMRGLWWSRVHGMDRLTMDVTRFDVPFLRQVLQAAAKPDPVDPVTGTVDERSTQQRHYDGFVELLRLAAAASSARLELAQERTEEQAVRDGESGGVQIPGLAQRATVLVHATMDQLPRHDGTRAATKAATPIGNGAATGAASRTGATIGAAAGLPVVEGQGVTSGEVFEHLTCDAPVRRALFDTGNVVLNLQSVARAATENQRQVIAARDRGCVAPGCGKPSWLTHAHHVRFWSQGGTTEVGNLVSLCGRHHRLLHAGGLEVRFAVDGRVEARWVRSGGRSGVASVSGWFRNTVPERMAQARSLAVQLSAEC